MQFRHVLFELHSNTTVSSHVDTTSSSEYVLQGQAAWQRLLEIAHAIMAYLSRQRLVLLALLT